MTNTQTTNDTKTRLENFDHTYEMSDPNNKWNAGIREEKSIKIELDKLTETELIELRDSLTVSMEWVNRHFSEYFKNLPTTPEPTAELVTDNEAPTNEPKSYLSTIMQDAWSFFNGDLFKSFGDALKAAWAKYKLVQSLINGIAYFSFIKADGSRRNAIGTNRSGNYQYESKGSTSKQNAAQIKYYDLEKRAYRSLNISGLVSIG